MPICDQLTPLKRILITIAVMSATLLQVLDMTIVNVALPHMQGSLAATPDQITWVLTSYLVASAIFMPLTGYFSEVFGQKKYLLLSMGGFILASMLCGIAESLPQMVIFRLLQGIFGASLVPLSQTILVTIFPQEKRGQAMAIWGMGVMLGPILGPTLGGYLTDAATWRWNFYINVPTGLLSLLLAWQVVPETAKQYRRMDWLGLILISIVIGALQYFLDRGNDADWFNAADIVIAAFLVAVCFPAFLWHLGRAPRSNQMVFDPRIFHDRNFTLSSLIMALVGVGMFGSMILLPLMAEGLLNYSVLTTGFIMAPRGISAMASMLLVSRLAHRIDLRILMMIGMMISAIGSYFGTLYSFVVSPGWLIFPMMIQGFGMGLIFVPASTLAFATLAPALRNDAAGMFSLLRTIGSSLGVSIISTLLSRDTQHFWHQLGSFIQPYRVSAIYHYFARVPIDPRSPAAHAILGRLLAQQANMIAFVNAYALVMWTFIIMLPLVFLLKKPKNVIEVVVSE